MSRDVRKERRKEGRKEGKKEVSNSGTNTFKTLLNPNFLLICYRTPVVHSAPQAEELVVAHSVVVPSAHDARADAVEAFDCKEKKIN